MADTAEEDEDTLTCPLCSRHFPGHADFLSHLRNKPGHIEILLAEMQHLRTTKEIMYEAVKAWRELALERGYRDAATESKS